MKNSKLIALLGSLTEKEYKQLFNHIEKHRGNNITLIQKLFILLNKHYPSFKQEAIRKVTVYKKLFPNYAYSESKFSKLMSELTKEIEDFLVTTYKSNSSIEESLLLLRFYYERNLNKYFVTIAKEIKSDLCNLPESSNKNIIKYKYAELVTSFELKSNNRYANYQRVYNELIELSESEKIRWQNLSLINLFPDLKEHTPNGLYYEIHRQLHHVLTQQDDQLFHESLATIEKKIVEFDKEESREILKIILDYSIQKVNNGVSLFYEYLLRVYKLFIIKSLILNDYGLINISTYKNYITVALKLGKTEDAFHFLEVYKEKLPIEGKEEVYTFNKTNIWFDQGNYHNIIELLNTTRFTDIFYKINQKRLLIKTYYELQRSNESYFPLLESHINAFYKFIYIEKAIPDIYINANKNFIKYIKKLISIANHKSNDKKKLLLKVKATQQLAEREWLEMILIREKEII